MLTSHLQYLNADIGLNSELHLVDRSAVGRKRKGGGIFFEEENAYDEINRNLGVDS